MTLVVAFLAGIKNSRKMLKSEDYLGKTIKVTYDVFDGVDYYQILDIDSQDQVVIRRKGLELFTVSRTWFERHDTGRNIEIIK